MTRRTAAHFNSTVMCLEMDLRYPSDEAVDSVLVKIGIPPGERRDAHDQDAEYTTCRVDELPEYVSLYKEPSTTAQERRVLGCYFMECLNELVEAQGMAHSLQHDIFELMHRDVKIHRSELKYWSSDGALDPESVWPIAQYLIAWQKTHNKTLQDDAASPRT